MEIVQLLFYGLVLGSIFALGAIGVSLTFGILGFANFSHGDLMATGAYVAFLVYVQLALPFWLALPVAIVATAALAVAIDRGIYRRFRRGPPVLLLISSFGMALIVRSLIQLIWGPEVMAYDPGIQLAERFMGLRYQNHQLGIIAGAIALVIVVHLFLSRTKAGKAMRAMADNPTLAQLSGIDTERVVMWTWITGGALAGAAGVFLAIDTQLRPEMGWFQLLPIFAAAILGGIGKPYGAIVGGYIIGMVTELSNLVLPAEYTTVVPFAILVVMLIFRPTGLFAGRSF
ncbi:MAG: branched-chain amino acid ABC transporter permease [Alphaproteobacteria bacterium]|jgi:branched-chain amino acid transport system permease protein/neutral amino acid transport system permease protein|nr:branched-chain amino acid ABC transporter permease [Alphaproteobacteria bacterium]